MATRLLHVSSEKPLNLNSTTYGANADIVVVVVEYLYSASRSASNALIVP